MTHIRSDINHSEKYFSDLHSPANFSCTKTNQFILRTTLTGNSPKAIDPCPMINFYHIMGQISSSNPNKFPLCKSPIRSEFLRKDNQRLPRNRKATSKIC